MGKQSSSRLTKKKKVNIIKKKKEKDRKIRKAAKNGIALPRNKLKKDLGIPNLLPDKKQILEKIFQKRQAEKQEKNEAKARKKVEKEQREQENNRLSEMAHLQYMAQRKQMEFNAKEELIRDNQEDSFDARDIKTASLSTASKRAYYKEFNKVVEASDVIIEVLDARDPMGCRCLNIEKAILSKHMNKKIILLLNKIDLIPREVVRQWLDYLRKEFPTVAFKSNTQKQSKNLSQGTTDDMKGCLGADTLIQLLKNYARSEDIKKTITVGIIGYPNVGKSSVINSLKRQKVAVVGSRPGVTTSAKEIQLDSNIKLIDSPGIIFSSASLDSDVILRNAVRIEQLEDTVEPVRIILTRCKPERLMAKYSISTFTSAEDFLTQVAKQSGKLLKGGKPNIQEAGKIILRDWNTGKIPFYTLPPKRADNVVDQFNMDNAMMQIDDSNVLNKLTTSVNDPTNNFIPMVASKPIEDDVLVTVDSDDEDGDAEMGDGDEQQEFDEDEEDGSDIEVDDD
nr:unnamed protein product [Naegleria fowleri]